MKKIIQTIPPVRFKGFYDLWKPRKLGNITYSSGKKNRENISYESFSITNENGFIPQDEKFENGGSMRDADKRMYIIVSPHSFAYNPARINVGSIGYQNKSKDVIVSSLYEVFKTTKDIDDHFLWHWFKSENFQKLIVRLQEGGVRLYFYYDKLCKGMILLPCLREQGKISEFLDTLDSLINLYQCKLEQQKKLKKYFLQNMFPTKGEKVPKIRLKGFTADWKQHKLKEIYENIGNAFVGTATPYYTSNGHFYLESNNVKDGQINREKEVFINDDFYEKQKDKWLHTGDIVMVQSGHVGHTAVIPSELDKTAAHALIMFRQAKIKVDPHFLNYQFQTEKAKKSFKNITVGNTIEHILASSMKEFIVDMPSYIEQQSISHYFKEMDCLINLQQRKLGELQSLKKYMLQNMFI